LEPDNTNDQSKNKGDDKEVEKAKGVLDHLNTILSD